MNRPENDSTDATAPAVKAIASFNPYARSRKDASAVPKAKAAPTTKALDKKQPNVAAATTHVSPPANDHPPNIAFSIKKGSLKELGTKKKQQQQLSLRAKLKQDIAKAKAKMARAMAKPKDAGATAAATTATAAKATSEPRPMTKAPPNVQRPVPTRMPVPAADEGMQVVPTNDLSLSPSLNMKAAEILPQSADVVSTAEQDPGNLENSNQPEGNTPNTGPTIETKPPNHATPSNHVTPSNSAVPPYNNYNYNNDYNYEGNLENLEAVLLQRQFLRDYSSIHSSSSAVTPPPHFMPHYSVPFMSEFPNQSYDAYPTATSRDMPNPPLAEAPPMQMVTPSRPWSSHHTHHRSDSMMMMMRQPPWNMPPPSMMYPPNQPFAWQQQTPHHPLSPWRPPPYYSHPGMPMNFTSPAAMTASGELDSTVSMDTRANGGSITTPSPSATRKEESPLPPLHHSSVTTSTESLTVNTATSSSSESEYITRTEDTCSTFACTVRPNTSPRTEGLTVTPSPPMLKDKDVDDNDAPSEPMDSWKEPSVKSPLLARSTTEVASCVATPQVDTVPDVEDRGNAIDASVKEEVETEAKQAILVGATIATNAPQVSSNDEINVSPPLTKTPDVADSGEAKQKLYQQDSKKTEGAQAPARSTETLSSPQLPQPPDSSEASVPTSTIAPCPSTSWFPNLNTSGPNFQLSSNHLNGLVPPHVHRTYPFGSLPFNRMPNAHHFGSNLLGPFHALERSWFNHVDRNSLALFPHTEQPSLASSGSNPIEMKGVDAGTVSNTTACASSKNISFNSEIETERHGTSKMALLIGATQLAAEKGTRENHDNGESRRAKKEKCCVLSSQLMEAPSPYVSTHQVVPHAMIVTKAVDGSFGIILKSVESSLLIDRPETHTTSTQAESTDTNTTLKLTVTGNTSPPGEETIVKATTTSSDQAAFKQRSRRRKRIHYVALQVINLCTQYEQFPIETSKTLQVGDLILSVHGKSVEGLTFAEAIKLFQSSDFDQSSN